MVNPYTPPTSSTTQRVPVVQPISWLATIPQLMALTAAVTIGWFAMHSSLGVFWGAAAYLIYSFGSRKRIPPHHRRGIRLMHAQRFEDAICEFEQSYEFFTRYSWLDRFRSITMMSPAAMSYREMALINIAFAYSQSGDGKQTKAYYQRAQDEFPDSAMARTNLALIESVERAHAESEA